MADKNAHDQDVDQQDIDRQEQRKAHKSTEKSAGQTPVTQTRKKPDAGSVNPSDYSALLLGSTSIHLDGFDPKSALHDSRPKSPIVTTNVAAEHFSLEAMTIQQISQQQKERTRRNILLGLGTFVLGGVIGTAAMGFMGGKDTPVNNAAKAVAVPAVAASSAAPASSPSYPASAAAIAASGASAALPAANVALPAASIPFRVASEPATLPAVPASANVSDATVNDPLQPATSAAIAAMAAPAAPVVPAAATMAANR